MKTYKMDVVYSRFFWGAVVIIIGLVIILNGVFKIHIPVVRLIFSLFFIYIGVVMLLGAFPFKKHYSKNGEETYIFSEQRTYVRDSHSEKYNTVFGRQTLDLSAIELKENTKMEVNTIFGSQDVILPENVNIFLHVNSAFASARLPNGNSVAFGESRYKYTAPDAQAKTLILEANVIFGDLKVKMKGSGATATVESF